MFKIKRNDIVQVTKGKDAGKKGKVLKVFCAKNRALVEGINLVKKHRRQTRQDQQAGIVS
ncbi:MAG TPA: 50S ribosomal protein L24, partial [Candidatus Omnitrophota bacterium]|nr:50S ribosomal protein L24 [Candidatus Omnitrophota bacterium]